jgi:hypothetical protein
MGAGLAMSWLSSDRDPYLRQVQALHVAQNCRNSPRRLRYLDGSGLGAAVSF